MHNRVLLGELRLRDLVDILDVFLMRSSAQIDIYPADRSATETCPRRPRTSRAVLLLTPRPRSGSLRLLRRHTPHCIRSASALHPLLYHTKHTPHRHLIFPSHFRLNPCVDMRFSRAGRTQGNLPIQNKNFWIFFWTFGSTSNATARPRPA